MSQIDPLTRALAHFNAEEYRDALLAFEERRHHERGDVLRALIQLSNALNQLRLGLITSPRRLLASADALLLSYSCYEGIELRAVRQYIAILRMQIPEGVETGAAAIQWDTIPRLRIERQNEQYEL